MFQYIYIFLNICIYIYTHIFMIFYSYKHMHMQMQVEQWSRNSWSNLFDRIHLPLLRYRMLLSVCIELLWDLLWELLWEFHKMKFTKVRFFFSSILLISRFCFCSFRELKIPRNNLTLFKFRCNLKKIIFINFNFWCYYSP